MMLRITAVYLIALGIMGIAWPFFGHDIFYPESISTNTTDLIKHFSRELFLASLLLIGGVGILKKQRWSRKVCLTALGLAFFYGGNKIGWQWAGGEPPKQTLIAAYGVSFIVFGLCFLLIFQQLTEENLLNSNYENNPL